MARVPTAIYIVIYSQGKWWVDFEGKAMGPCPDRETAARDAVRIARSQLLDDRPYEIWLALPEGTQRLGVVAASERHRTAATASPSVAPTSAALVPQPALPPAPALIVPPPVVVAPRPTQQGQVPQAAMSPVPPRLPPAPSLL